METLVAREYAPATMTLRTALLVALAASACNAQKEAPIANTPPRTTAPAPPPVASSAPRAAPPAPPPPQLVMTSVDLPGAKAPVTLDLIAYDRKHGHVWVPVGDTASVDVYDIAEGAFRRVDGFKMVKRERRGHERAMGPSSVTIGDGFAYVGTRSTSEVCAVDEKSLKLGKCLELPTPPDFVTYVAPAKEVWATTPRDHSVSVLDAKRPAQLKAKLVIKAPGSVEGAAVDAEHGKYFTNLEDKNQTLVIDIASHAIQATWDAGCDKHGPHGIAVDPARNLLFVACSDRVFVLDAAHDGKLLGELETGAGVDDIAYEASRQMLYVAASKARRLTVASFEDPAKPSVIATARLGERARNSVVDARGNVYVADAASARLEIFSEPPL